MPSAHAQHHDSRVRRRRVKEKRAACDGKRPKSREETPKEGSDSARRYRTATICGRAAQKASLFRFFPMQIVQSRPATSMTKIVNFVNWLIDLTDALMCCQFASVGRDRELAIS